MNQHHYSFGLNGILLGVDLYPKPSGLSMLRIVFLGIWINPKFGTVNASHCLPRHLDKPKAFQTNTSCSFGFFAPRLFTKASFRHSLETKKPLICMRGFVDSIGASLEEFAADVRAVLEAKL